MKTQEYPEVKNEFKVGDGASVCFYSDTEAYTVIKVTPKTITLQRDKATLLNGFKSGEPDALQISPGGFSGHTSGEQRYKIERDPNGSIIKAHMRKRPRKVWTKGAGTDYEGQYADVYKADFRWGSARIIEGRHEHYDYNF